MILVKSSKVFFWRPLAFIQGQVDCVWNVTAHAQKPDFVFRRNGRIHLNRLRASVQPTTSSRDMCISGSNAGYIMFRGSVKSTGYPLHSPVSPSLSPPVCHRVPSHFNWGLMLDTPCCEIVWRVLATHSIRQFSPSLSPPVRHRVTSHFNWALLQQHLCIYVYGHIAYWNCPDWRATGRCSRGSQHLHCSRYNVPSRRYVATYCNKNTKLCSALLFR